MKSTPIRNMRDIPTIQGLKNRTVPGSREQIVSELARLEHEKARIMREINVWLSNHKKALIRSQDVQERIDLLQRLITEQTPQPASDQPYQEVESPGGKFREVKFEY